MKNKAKIFLSALLALTLSSSVSQPAFGLQLKTRDIVIGSDSDRTARLLTQNVTLDPRKTVLLLIDVWDIPGTDQRGLYLRLKNLAMTKLSPLVAAARVKGIKVVHAPHGYKISRYTPEKPGDWHLDRLGINTTSKWANFLRSRGITTVLVAGGASNQCIVTRAVAPFQLQGQFSGWRIKQIMVEDGTFAIEYPETVAGELNHKAAIAIFRQAIGSTTTVQDVLNAN